MSLTKELQELTDAAIARIKREQQTKQRLQNYIFAEKQRIFNNFVACERIIFLKKTLQDNLIKEAFNGKSTLIMKFEISDFDIPGIITTYGIVDMGTPYDVFRLWFNNLEELKGTKYSVSNGDQFEFLFDWSIKQKYY
jgi:hypothetical protein